MPTRHLIGCVVAVVGVATALTLIAPSAGGFAVVAAFLLCPFVMVIAPPLVADGSSPQPRPQKGAPCSPFAYRSRSTTSVTTGEPVPDRDRLSGGPQQLRRSGRGGDEHGGQRDDGDEHDRLDR